MRVTLVLDSLVPFELEVDVPDSTNGKLSLDDYG